ncbi:MAG: glycoside hydrolase family 43 protein [Planctomycetota bacterium]
MQFLTLWCIAVILIAAGTEAESVDASNSIRPGAVWMDTNGEPINAHGGGILTHDGFYYWYGEHKGKRHSAEVGIRVYRSTDLSNWENAGVVLPVSDDPTSEITSGCVMERPKVLYNEHTGKFVMWFHLELKGHRYNAARTGCAIADTPTGPFRYLGSTRPNAGRFPVGASSEMREQIISNRGAGPEPEPSAPKSEKADWFFARDFYGGQMARDMTLFLDDDGTAYHIFAAEENYTLHIAELDETFTRHTGRFMRFFPGGHREAPALFKRNGRYHLITSGCTGWAPNAAQHAVADSIWGPWEITGNPCVGEGSNKTFRSQSTFVLPVVNKQDAFVFLADRWNRDNLADSRYLWLPIEFEGDKPTIRFVDRWIPANHWN